MRTTRAERLAVDEAIAELRRAAAQVLELTAELHARAKQVVEQVDRLPEAASDTEPAAD